VQGQKPFHQKTPKKGPKTSGRADKDVTGLRHVLVEFDLDENGNRIPKITRYNALIGSAFPITAIIDSGDKSLLPGCGLIAAPIPTSTR
jgi:hypothetical protein